MTDETTPPQPQEWREQAARVLGSFPMHEDDRGPDNEVLVDVLPYAPGEVMSGETMLYRIVDALCARLGPPPQARPDSPSRDHDHAVSALGWRIWGDAPKDGTEFIVYRPDAGVFAALWQHPPHEDGGLDWDEEPTLFASNGEDLSRDIPTHWMPLPIPPAEDDLSGRTAKPTDPLTIQDEPSSPPQADTAGLVEALTEAIAVLDSLNDDEINFECLPDLRQALALHRAASQGSAE